MDMTKVHEVALLADNMYRMGWDERNGGNISLMLDDTEAAALCDLPVIRTISIDFDASKLAGKCFIVTGTGSYFRNMLRNPEDNLGLFRIGADGHTLELLWGYVSGGRPTSELPAHLMSHISRLAVCPDNRVVIHTHATNLLAMTYVHTLNEDDFTHTLWQMCTECIVVFPDGVSVLPWMLCGTDEIGRVTADKMKYTRAVVWAQHGVFASGRTLDECFGLIETIEKSAEIYMKTAHLPIVNTISDKQLRELASAFGVTPREGILR